MISGDSDGRANPITLWTLLTLLSTMAPRAWSESTKFVCDTPVCKEVAALLDAIPREAKIQSCNDFFTHVCSGWFDKVVEKFPGRHRENITVGTAERLESALEFILRQELKQFKKITGHTSARGLRDSERQALDFYKSCRIAKENPTWNPNLITLRQFFHEVGLPFFDEPLGDRKSPFFAMMKLAIQFGISPLLRIEWNTNEFVVRKARNIIYTNEFVHGIREIANEWRSWLRNYSAWMRSDGVALTRVGALFEAYKLPFTQKTILRVGRHYRAVELGMEKYFELFPNDTQVKRIKASTLQLDITYYDLFAPTLKNLAIIDDTTTLNAPLRFFEALVYSMNDSKVQHVYRDFLGYHILEYFMDFASCGFGPPCDVYSSAKPARACAFMVSPSRSQLAMGSLGIAEFTTFLNVQMRFGTDMSLRASSRLSCQSTSHRLSVDNAGAGRTEWA